ncbi:unnamed protein product, partial [Laminaria digitata]
PIGIPVLYAAILWTNRKLLNPRVPTWTDGADESATGADSNRRGGKPPGFYYYEVIECGRRMGLTGVLIFIAPGTASQAAMSCIFAFGSIMGFELMRPH